MEELDETDKIILRYLQQDSKITATTCRHARAYGVPGI